jgi:hypothetical protein
VSSSQWMWNPPSPLPGYSVPPTVGPATGVEPINNPCENCGRPRGISAISLLVHLRTGNVLCSEDRRV